jgi:hypothetical protein
MCVSIESSSLVAAGFGTTLSQVAGFHRAVPSTTLDKACMQFAWLLYRFFGICQAFSSFFYFFVHNSVVDFSYKCDTIMASFL